ncbi:uncharacterized protein Dmul_28260 [Desulfococcus multivorans]|nr:uncharacterized protein Dmul_28260 [Desulfococcus multivorans]
MSVSSHSSSPEPDAGRQYVVASSPGRRSEFPYLVKFTIRSISVNGGIQQPSHRFLRRRLCPPPVS